MAEKSEAIKWSDDHYQSLDRVVLTASDLGIPGIRTFGWHDMKRAFPALSSHFHENCFEIVFATKGSISFFVDHREYVINGGDAFLTFPNEVHSTNGVPMSVGEICWLQLDVTQSRNFLFLSETAASSLISRLQRIEHHCIHTTVNKCSSAVVEIKEAILNTTRRDPYLIASYVVAYLYQLLACTEGSQARISLDMVQACEYIHSHICEDLPLEEIAEFCHMSESHFKQKFRAQIGASPRSYINKHKIAEICAELKKDTNLTMLASKYSFCNSAYFSTVFKKYTNKTPTEYISSLTDA